MITVPQPGEVAQWLGGNIDARVEIDTGLEGASFGLWGVAEWGVDLWGSADPNWTDITDYVLGIRTTQGAERWGQRFEAGTATIQLHNIDGRFTPDSGVDVFHLPFRPGRRIRVVAIPDGETVVPIWTGHIDAAYDSYADGGFDVVTTIQCLDAMALWGQHDPPMMATPTGVQSSDERVEAALDRFGWPAGLRDIQTGEHTVQTSWLAQSTLEECARAADAEGGAFYCGPDGSAIFRARDWLITDSRSIAIQGYLGYDTVPTDSQAAWAEAAQIVPSWERSRVINLVQYARVGGVMQEASDATSQVLFDVRSAKRTDLENNSDADVLFLAERTLDAFKVLRGRIDSVTITGVEDPANDDLNRLIWDTQIGDRLSINVEPPYGWSYEREVHVMGIAHEITGDDWAVTFRLDDAQTFEPPEE
jgi:hypothetical protein